MLGVPMYFVYRNGTYIDASGQSFRDFLKGKLPALPGEFPDMGDWIDHLTTAFPEVRLKRFLEMRGADSGPWQRLCALPALWVGLLYDKQALEAAWDLCKRWSLAEREQLRADVPRAALKAIHRGRSVLELAKDVLVIARSGLQRRAVLDHKGRDESRFLDILDQIAADGRSPAEAKLAHYNGRWNGSVDPIFSEFAY
jgi:glutamate--cysteine ligase